MRNGIKEDHRLDANGNPAGGSTEGTGIIVEWQNGPLGRHAEKCVVDPADGPVVCVEGCTRRPPNGAFVEDVIAAAKGRLEFYQASKFNCVENARALEHLNAALDVLDSRTKSREARHVEGTHGL